MIIGEFLNWIATLVLPLSWELTNFRDTWDSLRDCFPASAIGHDNGLFIVTFWPQYLFKFLLKFCRIMSQSCYVSFWDSECILPWEHYCKWYLAFQAWTKLSQCLIYYHLKWLSPCCKKKSIKTSRFICILARGHSLDLNLNTSLLLPWSHMCEFVTEALSFIWYMCVYYANVYTGLLNN